ncbi:ABC transporter permease [Bacteroidales bacterium]|nr:ABC transporter permease [Bacteroidales bacterium]
MKRVMSKPDNFRVTYREFIREVDKLGLDSIIIVIIISIFIGAVITLQTFYNTESSYIPTYLVGLTARDTILLEFSSTIVGLILAGKVGSNIASEIGTMRVSQQIDALEIMGVNSANYLIFPKITAMVFYFPFLTMISMVSGNFGGWISVALTDTMSPSEFIFGIRFLLVPFYITYALFKTLFFAFVITSVPAFQGYYVNGGSLEVGKASTRGVVYSSILILLLNVVLTQIMLA